MNTHAIKKLIEISYSVPNGHNLRKACYEVLQVSSKKASFGKSSGVFSDITEKLMSLGDNEKVKAAAQIVSNTVEGFAKEAAPYFSKALKNYPELEKITLDAIKDPKGAAEHFDKWFVNSITKADIEKFALENGLDPRDSANLGKITNMMKKELLFTYDHLKQGAEHYAPDALLEGLEQRHMDALWEKGEYMSYVGAVYHSCFNWLGHELKLDPHTLEICATALAAGMLAYLLYRNRRAVFSVIFEIFKGAMIVVVAPFGILYALLEAGKSFVKGIGSFFSKMAKQNVIRQAIQTQNKKVIVLACKI